VEIEAKEELILCYTQRAEYEEKNPYMCKQKSLLFKEMNIYINHNLWFMHCPKGHL